MKLGPRFGVIIILAAIAVLVLFFIFIIGAFLPSISFQNMQKAEVKIGGGTFSVDVAEHPLERARGLSGRDSMPENGGMLFRFDRPGVYSFWMKDMRFPIDIFWLKGGRVVFLVKNAAPPGPEMPDSELEVFRPGVEADRVLELSGGTADRLGVKIGDEVSVTIK